MIQPTGPEQAKIMIVGEFAHEQDILRNAPFIGGAGFELTKMLMEAGIPREQCFLTLVHRTRAPGGRTEGLVAEAKKYVTSNHVLHNDKWVLREVMDDLKLLKAEIERVKPNVVIAMGNLALWALTGEWGVTNWRSSVMESTLVPGQKVIPTLNPNMVLVNWPSRPMVVHDLKRAKRQSAFPEIIRTDYSFVIRPDYETAVSVLTKLADECEYAHAAGLPLKIASDIETRAGHIACIAFAWTKTNAICIPLMSVSNPEGYWTLEQETNLVMLMCRILMKAHIIGQNWNYDATYIHHFWHHLSPLVTDTMIQQHSCFSNLEKGLAYLSSMYCEDHLYWKDDRTNWTEGPKGEGEDQYWIYNCTDAVRTLAINEVLDKVVESLDVVEVNRFQQHLRYLALKCMNTGFLVHEENRKRFSFGMLEEVAKRNAFIEHVVGHELNIQSPLQMQQFFYGEMAMTPIMDKKTGSKTTNDQALQVIAQREPILAPMCRKIAELRTLKVLHSTFIEAGVDRDGRMRTSFNVAGTDTYRFASKKNPFGGGCNFENVTKGGESEDGMEIPNVRKIFRPDPGHDIFDTDLDSADLRIVTWESNCQWMKEQFNNGRKPYVEVMKEYYHDQGKSKHSKEYPMFKALCHGTNYLGTAAGIAPRIGLLVHETERIQKWYYGMCPEIRKWQEEIKKQVAGRRYIQNAYGYKFHFFDRIQGTIFNQAVAWIPQSTVSCLINRIWEAIDNNLPEVTILNQVHDSLVGQFESHLGDWAKRRIIEESNIPIPYEDPLFIPMGIVTSRLSWGDCK
jgi:DNA polymerase I-like protein with 3'-5' exonuclease and polymerase domains/uracil-DNA glycosylase